MRYVWRLTLAFFFLTGMASAATYYVAVNGNDGKPDIRISCNSLFEITCEPAVIIKT